MNLYRLLFLFTITILRFNLFAQAPGSENDQVYGYDPVLYNGKIYFYYPEKGTEGTQYLFDNFDNKGSVTIRGKVYKDVSLNFDIFNHQLIMQYINAIGSTSFIEVSFAWLEKASLGGHDFEIVTGADSTKRMYQVLGMGNEKILNYWRKDLLIDNLKGTQNHYFSSARKEMLVMINNRIVPFHTNKGFVKAFGEQDQSLIKSYIHKRSINVKTANDLIMTDLINYCNTLSGS